VHDARQSLVLPLATFVVLSVLVHVPRCTHLGMIPLERLELVTQLVRLWWRVAMDEYERVEASERWPTTNLG
jgi:hypothetical protein